MLEPTIARIPPHDLEAEQAVLASMLFDREAIASAQEIITGGDFYSPANQHLYETMAELFSRGVPVDVVTLNDKLAEKGLLEQIGGRETVIRLAGIYYTSANIKQHAQIVAEKSVLRQLIKASGQILSSGYDARESLAALLEHAEKSIFDISQRNTNRDFKQMGSILDETLKKLEELYQTQGAVTGVPTGFIDLDRMLAGLQSAELILVGARPSMGKTAFLLNIAQHAAIDKGVPTAIFSLEMSDAQLANRMLSAEAHVHAERMRTGRLEGDDWDKVSEAVSRLSAAPIYIDDTPGISITDMRAKCRRLKIEKNLGLVIVDYLQLMSAAAGSRPESRQLEISEISRSLKAMAKELDVPIVVAAQLSRAVEARKDHRPMLSDLRESGAIEQDADVVAFLYRDEYYNPETMKKNHAEVIIAKQRNGPVGTVELTFLGAYTKFANMNRQGM
ncbi:MAG: replicative DNA helicase [Defluviitaleaceae bacterium]|nr:replicative DNA helicase [Defluviitaleaceae bacterium]MCL2261978.1 replicative DNA helicase [Defluviitaleaceae bacterium]